MTRVVVLGLLYLFSVVPAFAQATTCQIGVIPIAGDLFLIHKYGAIRLLDKHARVGVVGWGLDELVVSRVQAAAPGRSVRRIPYTAEELGAARDRKQNLYSREANFRAFLQEIAARIRCERYVVVHRRGDAFEFGIGISNYGVGGRIYLFALMQIRVYDGRTFELIREAPAYNDTKSSVERIFNNPAGGPHRELTAEEFPAKPSDVSGNRMLRDGVRALLTSSLDMTLPEMLK